MGHADDPAPDDLTTRVAMEQSDTDEPGARRPRDRAS